MKKVSYVCLYSFSLLLAALPLQQMMGEQVSKVEGLTVQSVQQQGRKITGQVVDDKTGDPLIGVNVKVKGTTMGTITDLDGRFTLTVTTKNPVIIVSYIGYSQQELTASGNQLNIKLKEDAMALDEVVVVGYGVQKKSLVTGAIASVKGSEVEVPGCPLLDIICTPGVFPCRASSARMINGCHFSNHAIVITLFRRGIIFKEHNLCPRFYGENFVCRI